MATVISFVYFDLGGVVVLDFSGTNKWAQLKKELGVPANRYKEFDHLYIDKYEPEVNIGRDVETIIPLIEKRFGSKLPGGYSLLKDGFVARFETNRSIWPVITLIHKKCKIGMLTNAYPNLLKAVKKRGLLPKVRWDVIIDSSTEGVRKPEPAIFKLAEQRSGVRGKKILFVENTYKHIQAAKLFGWQTFLYDPIQPEDSSTKLAKLFKSI